MNSKKILLLALMAGITCNSALADDDFGVWNIPDS